MGERIWLEEDLGEIIDIAAHEWCKHFELNGVKKKSLF